MSDITWENPPTPTAVRRASKHDDLVKALRRRPGKWAVFSEDAPNSAGAAINSGKITAFAPAGTFEATSRANGNRNRVKIYVRYVGKQTTHPGRLAAIRGWAAANGWEIANRGRVPQQIVDAYDAAHEESAS